MALEGIAIGGESIGYNMPKTREILSWLHPILPDYKPRYTMGVGSSPQDLIDVVAAGADIFDCVAPTRIARHGVVYCGQIVREMGWVRWDSDVPNGRINLNNNGFAMDDQPIMLDCGCVTCQAHSRAYLRYLLKSKALGFHTLATIHNLYVMEQVCQAMREVILNS